MTMVATKDAISAAITAIAAAKALNVDAALIDEVPKLHRSVQLRWDFIAAENSMSFLIAEEALRILASAIDFSHQALMKTLLAVMLKP